jgi:uncharacterized protein (TIGR00296 family)
VSKLLTVEEGALLVRLARQVIETYVREKRVLSLPKTASKALQECRGVFVTLKKRRGPEAGGEELRGCIGRLQPDSDAEASRISLLEATREAAISSAVQDPRFLPVKPNELDTIVVEVSVLTPPEEIVAADRTKLPQQITVGRDGLIMELDAWRRGLLLPQVAPEQNWNAKQFLEGCCHKAGLSSNSYLDPRVKVYKFQAQIFSELSVRGQIEERHF